MMKEEDERGERDQKGVIFIEHAEEVLVIRA
jgi:hypothetical protein